MAADLIITPRASDDLDEAFQWYEARRTGLGEEFLNSFDACIRVVLQNPELYAFVRKTYRRALMRRFPYAILFEFARPSVVVYAVFHTSRRPDRWHRRLP